MRFLHFFALTALLEFAIAADQPETYFCNTFVRPNGYTCTEYQTTTSDGYVLNIQRVGESRRLSPPPIASPPPGSDIGAQISNLLGPLANGLTRSRISTAVPPSTSRAMAPPPISLNAPRATRGRRGYQVSRVAASTCENHSGMDYYGNDLPPSALGGVAGGLPSPSVSDCCAKCQTQSGCKAYSWQLDGSSGKCYLKSAANTPRPQNGVTGGIIRVTDSTSAITAGNSSVSASPPKSDSKPPTPAVKPPTSTQPPPPAPKFPVFLDHALFLGGDIWFDGPPPSTRLPFLLVDAGFDVYVAQHRATKYSPDNINLARNSFNYWDFTFDDLVKNDLPPLMKVVQGVSGHRKVHFVGFNQGGILPLAAMASDPSFAKKLASLTMIGPITFIGNITSPVLHSWGTGFSPDEVFYNQRLVNGQYNLTNTQNLNDFLGLLGGNIGDLFGGGNTNQLLNNVTGPNCCVPNKTISTFNSQIDPNWVVTSYKNLVQYQQEIRSGKFAKYNYRTSAQNQRAYNRTLAPSYDLSLIPPSLPIFLVSGENDWFADKKNIQKLRANLPQDPTFLEVPKYAHFDLIFSESIAKDVYTPIIEYLQSGFRN